MRKFISAVLLTISFISFNASAALVTTTSGLVDPQDVRDSIPLTDYGLLELEYVGFGTWSGFSNVLPTTSNALVFDIPVLDFPFSNGLLTYSNGATTTFIQMGEAFNLANFEAAVYIVDGFNRFAFQVTSDVNDVDAQAFYGESVFVENIKYGSLTQVSAPGAFSIILLGLALITFRRLSKKT